MRVSTKEPRSLQSKLTRNCYWCNHDSRDFVSSRLDGMKVFRCRSCGHHAIEDIVIDLETFYDNPEYFEHGLDYGYSQYRNADIQTWSEILFSCLLLKERKLDASILDIGAATGLFLNYCKGIGLKTFALDTSDWARKQCELNGHTVIGENLDSIPHSQSFDILTALHVLEHVAEPSAFLAKINSLINNGSKFIAAFPNVNFKEENWSGKDSSFEHISYFTEEFVETHFSHLLTQKNIVICGLGQIYCFAGNFENSTERALELTKRLVSANPLPNLRQLRDELSALHEEGILFLINFVACNHSASRASELLSMVRSDLPELLEPNWFNISLALLHLQNGNLYGTLNSLNNIDSPKTDQAEFVHAIESILPRNFATPASTEYDTISVVVCCGENKAAGRDFYQSLGDQTYPNIEVLHVSETNNCKCEFPPRYEKNIKVLKGKSDKPITWQNVFDNAKGKLFVWSTGDFKMSPFCLFALAKSLETNPGKVIAPQALEREGQTTPHFPGQRTIENFLKRQLNKTPAFFLFDRMHPVLRSSRPVTILEMKRFEKELNKNELYIHSDPLTWRIQEKK